MWEVTPGWCFEIGAGDVVVLSDSRAYKITLSPSLIKAFFPDGVFAVPSTLNQEHQIFLAELQKIGVVFFNNSSKLQPSQSHQFKYFIHIGLDVTEAQHRIRSSCVLVLGLGGTGSIIIEQLVRAGVGRFILVDDDVVETSNLERQFIYDISQINRLKTDAAEDYILTHNRFAHVRKFNIKIDSPHQINDILSQTCLPSLCCICVDHPPLEIFDICSEFLWNNGIPSLHGGVMAKTGFWGPLFSQTFGSPHPSSFSLLSNHDGGTCIPSPSDVCFTPYNSIIAAHMASDALHFLAGAYQRIDYHRRTFVNFEKLTFEKLLSAGLAHAPR